MSNILMTSKEISGIKSQWIWSRFDKSDLLGHIKKLESMIPDDVLAAMLDSDAPARRLRDAERELERAKHDNQRAEAAKATATAE